MHNLRESQKLRPLESEGGKCTCGSEFDHQLMVASVDDSFCKDRERWIDSYMNHNATALQKRASAQQNGHGGL
ncbi:MAG TPA: hypothetical protein VGE97_06585 [Nitrososphaera sp.]|jgi:hypothetical protein